MSDGIRLDRRQQPPGDVDRDGRGHPQRAATATGAGSLVAAGMGQNLMSPPNVKGWPGGETWINTTTLLTRKQFVDRLLRAGGAPMSDATAMSPPANAGADAMNRALSGLQFDSARFLAQFPGASPDERARWAQRLLLAVPPQQPSDRAADALAIVRGYVLDAAYRLK